MIGAGAGESARMVKIGEGRLPSVSGPPLWGTALGETRNLIH